MKVWKGTIVGFGGGDDVFVELGPRMQGVISRRAFETEPVIGDVHEFTLRGQAVARPKHAVLDRGNDLRGDLLVPRACACGKGSHPRHVCFFQARGDRHVLARGMEVEPLLEG